MRLVFVNTSEKTEKPTLRGLAGVRVRERRVRGCGVVWGILRKNLFFLHNVGNPARPLQFSHFGVFPGAFVDCSRFMFIYHSMGSGILPRLLLKGSYKTRISSLSFHPYLQSPRRTRYRGHLVSLNQMANASLQMAPADEPPCTRSGYMTETTTAPPPGQMA